jgi:ElaB/YqjD/DUF883 family membrane-anchored ribosome-binding protein
MQRVREGVKEESRRQADHARQQITEFTRRHQQRWSQRLSSLERALHQTADTLRQDDGQPMADYADRAAERLGRLSHRLHDMPPQDLLAEVEEFTRRRPGITLGVAIGAGLLLGRFLRDSAPRFEHGSPPPDAGGENPPPGQQASGAEGAASRAVSEPGAAPREAPGAARQSDES